MTRDRKIQGLLKISLIVISFSFLILLPVFAKELPLLVSIPNLSDSHDGHRVAIFGWARSVETIKGRMGTNYIRVVIGEDDSSVTVFSSFPVFNILDRRIIVQGKYHKTGRFGGFFVDHFIVADDIVRDWGEVTEQ
ncbi:MAG: hypothetical protein ACE5HN_03680 [Nitrospiria bacterium]